MASGRRRVRLAITTGIPAAETATPMTIPAKKVKTGRDEERAMPATATACSVAPAISTARPPMRSATWPQIGWVTPLTST